MKQVKRCSLVLFLLWTGIILFFSCSRADELSMESMLELQSPYGQWKLESFAIKGSVQKQIVLGGSNAYLLTLNKDGTFTGTTSANNISGKFTIDMYRGGISFSAADFFSSNRMAETNEGSLYLSRLLKVKRYRVFTSQLHLYYSDNEYLLFVKVA